MFNWVPCIIWTIGILVMVGLCSGGIYLTVTATNQRICSDWSYDSAYAGHRCTYTYMDAGALIYCNNLLQDTNETAQCVCYDPITEKPSCITTLPAACVSPSLLAEGIGMLIVSIIMVVCFIVYLVTSGKRIF